MWQREVPLPFPLLRICIACHQRLIWTRDKYGFLSAETYFLYPAWQMIISFSVSFKWRKNRDRIVHYKSRHCSHPSPCLGTHGRISIALFPSQIQTNLWHLHNALRTFMTTGVCGLGWGERRMPSAFLCTPLSPIKQELVPYLLHQQGFAWVAGVAVVFPLLPWFLKEKRDEGAAALEVGTAENSGELNIKKGSRGLEEPLSQNGVQHDLYCSPFKRKITFTYSCFTKTSHNVLYPRHERMCCVCERKGGE